MIIANKLILLLQIRLLLLLTLPPKPNTPFKLSNQVVQNHTCVIIYVKTLSGYFEMAKDFCESIFQFHSHIRCFCCRSHAVPLQESLPAAAVQEDRRRRVALAEREESGLRHHLPDTLYPAALHAQVRHAVTGLQRPSLHLRRRARRGRVQGAVIE